MTALDEYADRWGKTESSDSYRDGYNDGVKAERAKNDIVLRKTTGDGGWMCYSQSRDTKPKFGATPEQALQAHLTTPREDNK